MSDLTTSSPSRARRFALTAPAAVLVGIAGGLAWWWLAEPAEWEARAEGIQLTAAASTGQFSVVVVFIAVGAVASFGWALGAAYVLRDAGWVTTPFVIVMTLLAAVIAWRIGVELGPPDPATVTGTSVGDRIPSALEVDAAAFLAWPVFGLAGLLVGSWISARLDDRRVARPVGA